MTTLPKSRSDYVDAIERSVLGALLLDADAVPSVRFLLASDFAALRHSLILEAIRTAHNDRRTTSPLVVGEALGERLHECGGHEYLLDLLDGIVHGAEVVQHARLVQQHAGRRRLNLLGREIALRAESGDDVSGLVTEAASIAAGTAGTARSPAQVRTIGDLLASRPPRWLIKGLVPQASVGFVGSQPNVGKSTLALGWAMSVYHGCDWLGHRVLPGSVVLVLGEGIGGMGARIQAWQREHAGETAGRYFRVVTDLPPLSHPSGQAALGATLETIAAEQGHAPALVVVDTLSSLWGGESEDRPEFAGPFMRCLGKLAERHGSTFAVCHHLAKGPQDKPSQLTLASLRGSGAFGGASDWVFGLEPRSSGARLLTLKQKDSERGAPIDLRLHKVVLGANEDGDEVSAAFFVPAGEPPADAPNRADLDAEASRHIRTVVDKLREMGSAPSANSVVKRCHGNRQHLLAAWKEAEAIPLIADIGTTRLRKYVVVDRKQGDDGSESARAVPPRPPTVPEPGTTCGAGPEPFDGGAVPGTSGNQLGTRAKPKRERHGHAGVSA